MESDYQRIQGGGHVMTFVCYKEAACLLPRTVGGART
jgi:hypothetical protein